MFYEAPSHDNILWRRWPWTENTSKKMVVSVALLAFHSSTQKAGVMMCLRNIVVVTTNLNLPITV